ncbi:MAG: hypothetical protein IJZ57_01535 [Clostridia bacterium]|nr:hypothetical protein [Clostridia bacterium]
MADLLSSLVEYFSNMDWDALMADFQVIIDGVDFDLVVETFKSLADTISALFA